MLKKLAYSLDFRVLHVDHLTIGSYWCWKNVSSPFSRLYLVTRGTASVRFRNTTYTLSPGKLYLIPCFERHDYSCPDTMGHYFVHFTSQLGAGTDLFTSQTFDYCVDAADREYQLFSRLVELNPQKKLADLNPTKRISRQKDGSEIESCDNDLIDSGQELGTIVESNGILMQLLAPILKTARDVHQDEKIYATRRLENVLRYVEENLNQNITLAEMASVVHLNPTYFSNMFTQLMGIRPTEYVNKKRIEKAQLLLLCSGKRPSEVAAEVGFTDINYFSRVFRKYIGLPPQKYVHTILNGPK